MLEKFRKIVCNASTPLLLYVAFATLGLSIMILVGIGSTIAGLF